MKLTEIENPRTGDRVFQVTIPSSDIQNLNLIPEEIRFLNLVLNRSNTISGALRRALFIASKIEQHNRLKKDLVNEKEKL